MESEVEQLSQTANGLPLPGTEAYEALPQFPKRSSLPFRRTIRRQELRQIVPLAETTIIYKMERRGEFPRRFNLTPRCVVWYLAKVEAWIEARKQAPGVASRSRMSTYENPPCSVTGNCPASFTPLPEYAEPSAAAYRRSAASSAAA